MQESDKLDVLNERFKSYVNTKTQLIKLELVERSAVLASGLFAWVLILLFLLLSLLFLSIGVGVYIGQVLENYYLGFISVAGFYALIVIVLFLSRSKLVELPIRNAILKQLRNPD